MVAYCAEANGPQIPGANGGGTPTGGFKASDVSEWKEVPLSPDP